MHRLKTRLPFLTTLGVLGLMALALIWGAPHAPADAPVTVTFWHAMEGHRGEVLQALVDRFNQAHPNIQVQAVYQGGEPQAAWNPYSNLYRHILENLADGNAANIPDISQVYENWTTQLIGSQKLAPIQDVIAASGQPLTQDELADFVPAFLKANTYNGTLWTLPFNKSIYVLYYNKDAFAEANLTPPKTWQQLRSVAKQLTVYQGNEAVRVGLVFYPNVDNFSHYFLAYGGEFVEGNKAAFDSDIGRNDLKFWLTLVHQDRAARPSFDAQQAFLDGKGAMYIETTSKMANLEKKATFGLGAAPLPMGSQKRYMFAGTNLAIFANASPEKRQAAWTFIRWLLSPDNTAEWALETGYLPVRTSAIATPKYQAFLAERPDRKAGLESLQFAEVQPRVAAWETIRGILDDLMYQVVVKQGDAGALLQDSAKAANMLLD